MNVRRAQAPTVVYLAGSGRSGSTLVERMLGGIPGYVNVGELIDLFRRVRAGDERCGCGLAFSGCAYWQEVGGRAFGGWDSPVVNHVASLQAQIARQRHIPLHLSPWKSAPFRRTAALYRSYYARLYRALAVVAEARVVVDSSKWPAQGLALVGEEIDLRVIHVRRDVRGVAWSMTKRDFVRPQATARTELMASSGLASAAARWTTCQTEVDLLALTGLPLARMRYEDLVRSARGQVQRALEAVGLPVDASDLEHLGTDHAWLGASHGLSGNPSRFTQGATRLRVDEAWRQQMSTRDRALVTTIGFPHLVRHSRWVSRSVPSATERR